MDAGRPKAEAESVVLERLRLWILGDERSLAVARGVHWNADPEGYQPSGREHDHCFQGLSLHEVLSCTLLPGARRGRVKLKVAVSSLLSPRSPPARRKRGI